MSSKRKSRSKERSKIVAPKLRMDSKPQTPRITDPSLPAGRRREIDNVMKKARAASDNQYWDKKLLEVEAKDPNRWRHSGYKSLYMDGSLTPSPSRRSRSRSRSHSRSPRKSSRSPRRASRSPRRTSRSPRRTSRSPRRASRSPRRASRSPRRTSRSPRRSSRSPRRSGSPVGRRRSPVTRRTPSGRRSPPAGRRAPPSPPSGRGASPGSRYTRSRSWSGGPPSPPAFGGRRQGKPRSPPVRRRSGSARRSPSNSDVSSCSGNCSVCRQAISPKRARSRSRATSPQRAARKPTAKPTTSSPAVKPRARPRPPSPSPAPRMPRSWTPNPPVKKMPKPSPSGVPTDPRRQPPPPRPRGRTGEIIDVPGVKLPPRPVRKPKEKMAEPVLLTKIKKERTKKRPGSPGGDSSGSEDSSASTASPIVATTRLTLSERFGKIAQWSADRERRDIENMRITKTGGDLKVMIEEDDFLYGTPPRSLSPVPAGSYPEELLASGPSRLAAWDDVRVRYQYYKELGYLRDLTIDDYVKWEEWWYKYQDWLANERHYEHWMNSNRRRRKRVPITKRLA